MMNGTEKCRHAVVAVLTALLAPGGLLAQQQARGLSLDDALQIAQDKSEQVTLAKASVMRAQGQKYQARSQYFPQLNGSLGYTRTLASEFSALSSSDTTTSSSSSSSDEKCEKFAPNPALPLAQRIDSLEHAVRCASNANPFSAFK